MKKIKSTLLAAGLGAFLMGCLIFCSAQSTQQRVMLSSSAFWRGLLTNETAGDSIVYVLTVGKGSTNFWVGSGTNITFWDINGLLPSVIFRGDAGWLVQDAAGTHTAQLYGGDQIVGIPGGSLYLYGSANLVVGGFLYGDGFNISNAIPRFTTNVIPANAVLLLGGGRDYTTNLTSDTTLAAYSLVNPYGEESAQMWITNGDSAPHKVTTAPGTLGPPGFGDPPVFWCTNGARRVTRIRITHYGIAFTNAEKQDYAP